jgi:amino acid permease
MAEDNNETLDSVKKEQHQAKEEKRKRSRKIGAILLILGAVYAGFAVGFDKQAVSAAERAGAHVLPAILCLLGGYFFFIKGGGKIV